MQRLRVLAVALATLLPVASAVPAQSGGAFLIDRAVIGAGGATSSAGAFRLSGTVGQPLTDGPGAGAYRLYDGFWGPVTGPATDEIFANGFDP
jgi:hypothetical protein